MIVTIKNRTPFVIDICKASTICTPIPPETTFSPPLTCRGWVHGHSQEGSFVIQKDYNDITFKVWGDFTVSMQQTKEVATVTIMMKK